MTTLPTQARALRSTVSRSGQLELKLVETPVDVPAANEVVIRIEASPINPSDLGLLLAGADLSTAKAEVSNGSPVITASIDQKVLATLSGRFDEEMAVGNEGAGTVVATGDSPAAQALLGRVVSVAGGSMYAQYRTVDASACLVLPEGTPARAGASSFVNPLTALGMVETMRREGHSALIHTAAASNLGQMLVKICQADGVPLINVVRSESQEATLRSLGATFVCNSASPTFLADLTAAIFETGATLAFDATGGGNLASKLLNAMEAAANAKPGAYSRYGSNTYKQVYIYGGLDRSQTVLTRNFGFAWGLGGWLLTPFLMKAGGETISRLRQRVVDELTTTFASHYSHAVTLEEALDLAAITDYARQATGSKYLITPHGA
ncbi:MAG: zinc-binding dehydrogenase [Actinomycetota bacterium]